MIEGVGFGMTTIGLAVQLYKDYKDFSSWDQQDVDVDREFLPAAVAQGHLDGAESDYRWMAVRKLATAEMNKTHSVVHYINADKKIKCRLFRDKEGRTPLVLVKNIEVRR